MIYLQLFWEFLKIGLFAVGGGMATLPFLQRLSVQTGWFSQDLITDMIAVSESTPGPIGINMATYVGCNIAGVPGGIIATIGEVLPSVIIVILVSKSLERFRNNPLVGHAFYGLRPAVTGLIAAALLNVFQVAVLNISALIGGASMPDIFTLLKLALFAAFFYAIRKFKKHPILYIAAGAVLGIVLKL